MRVVAGELKSRRLGRPPPGVRPTSDRVRESVFARLGDVAGAVVLDLYAGTGALGIEALSRGASSAVLVERAPRALASIRDNVERLGLTERTRVLRGDATTWVGRLGVAGDPFDLVFVDPPYESVEADRAVLALARAEVLALHGAVVVEAPSHHSFPPIPGLRVVDEWGYGDTLVTRFERCSAGSS